MSSRATAAPFDESPSMNTHAPSVMHMSSMMDKPSMMHVTHAPSVMHMSSMMDKHSMMHTPSMHEPYRACAPSMSNSKYATNEPYASHTPSSQKPLCSPKTSSWGDSTTDPNCECEVEGAKHSRTMGGTTHFKCKE
jgi:hypothetical protein